MSMKRYDMVDVSGCENWQMIEGPNGAFVRFEDVQAAILAERKRCATIAARYKDEYISAGMTHPEDSEPRDRCFARSRAAMHIEDEIRSGAV